MTDTSKAFKVQSNDFVFYFDREEINSADLVQTSSNEYNCLHHHHSVNATILEADLAEKKFKISIAGDIFFVSVKDELDQMLENMGFGTPPPKSLTHIKAPMPGLVLEINVAEGQSVSPGDKLLILEAMKMENSIMIPASATIKKILISKGQAVDRGQVLIELE